MSTYFDTVQKARSPLPISAEERPPRGLTDTRARSQSFVDVPVHEHGVDTLAFLEATEGLIKMFGARSPRSLARAAWADPSSPCGVGDGYGQTCWATRASRSCRAT